MLSKSQLNPKRLALMLAASLLIPLTLSGAGVQALPDLGSAARAAYSLEDERQLGRQVMAQIRQSLDFVDDPELQHYIQTLGSNLAKHTGDDFFQFFMVRDTAINAFALPGGYIGLHTGLIINAQKESELAAVIAHEIVHVNQQHWSRMMAARKERSGLTAAALLASLVLAGSGSNVGEAGIALTAAVNISQELSFSREYEREADRIGIQLLAKSGYQAESMADFFGRLQAAHRLTESSGPEYLRTHPITTNRIAEARDRARQLRGSKNPNESEFLYSKARILALYARNAAEASSQLKTNLAGRSSDAYLYGQSLLMMRISREKEALTIATKLRKKYPNDLRFLMLQADIQLAMGNKKSGLSLYESAYQRARLREDIMLRYASALIHQRAFEKAYQLLKSARRHPPQHPHLQKLFAQAAGETGRLIDSHRSMAEYYFLQGNTDSALQQLRIARNHAGKDAYLLAGIDARSKEIEATIKQAK